jgi:multiple sugar transport system permease protein
MAVAEYSEVVAPAQVSKGGGQRGAFGRIGRHWADYLYVAPAILVMLVVIGWPIVYTVYLSFFNTTARNTRGILPQSENYVGLQNYQDILSSDTFWKITQNTFVWTIGSTIGAFALGFGAALVVQREFIGRGVIRAILLIPWVISFVSAAYVWRWLYHSDFGLISGTLKEWGLIDKNLILLDNIHRVLPALIVVNVWKEFPFVMIMMLAGLQTVPDQLMRAARVDGANALSRFWHVTVPHLRGVILITTLLLFVANLNSFGLVWIMTAGGPADASELWITEIYSIAFRSIRFGEASAFSVILFLFMMFFVFLYVRALTGGQKRRAPG